MATRGRGRGKSGLCSMGKSRRGCRRRKSRRRSRMRRRRRAAGLTEFKRVVRVAVNFLSAAGEVGARREKGG